MPYVTVAHRKVHYELDNFTKPWQPAETLLIQHGMSRNAQFWRDWAPALGRQWQIIRRDLPGHGDSQAPPPDYVWRLEDLVRDTVGFLDALNLERVHFLGESTAGMLGIMLAAQHPERLHSLILCASPTTIGPAAQKFFAGAHADWQTALQTLGTGGWGRWLVSQGGTLGAVSDAQREWVIEQIGRIPTHVLVGYSKMVSGTDVTPLLEHVRAPTLILSPTRSAATPPAQQQALAAQIRGAHRVVIDGSGHEIYADQAEACCAAVREFLAASRTRSGSVRG
jgi:pimeloyl-ACP methyl ester carboxylesterase